MQDISKQDSVTRNHSSDRSHDVPAWSRVLRGGRMTKWKGAAASYAPNVAEIVSSVAGRALPVLLATGLMAGSAAAAGRYWDSNATTPGYGGTGTWDLTAQSWSPSGDGVSGPYTPWSNSALDDAIFGGTAGTVTLGSPITAHGLTFNTDGYILTGGTLNLAGATPTITVNSGTATIDSVIAGSSGLTKAGVRTLVLGGINTFTGDIHLNAGGITADSDAALGAASNGIVTAAGASVVLSIAGANTDRTVTIGDGGTLTVAGSGAGSALVTGDGRVIVGRSVTMSNDASTYTGSTTFNGVNGVAFSYFTSIGNLNEASSLGAPTTVADGTIIFNQSSQYSDNVIYIGDGDSSDRNWDLNGAAALIRNQGTGTLSITGDVDTSGGSGFYAEDADIELLGILSGGNYSFNGNAGRTITLGGANTYTGTTNIGAIAVRATVLADAGADSSFGSGNDAITIASNGTLNYTGAGSSSNRAWTIGGTTAASASGSILNDGSGALALSGAVDFDSAPGNSLTLGGSFSGVNTLSGVVSGTGDIISDGASTWVLSGANTREGAVIVESGTLRAGNASAFGTVTDLAINGGTLDLGGFDLVAPSLEGTGGGVALGANTLTVHTTETTSYAGVIGGTGGLTKAGLGALTLSGANTYTGDTTLGGGTLTLDYSASGAPATNIIAGASTLNMAGGKLDIIGADSATNIQSFNGLNVTAGSNQIATSSGAGGTMTVNFGAITRTGGLVDFALPTDGSFTTTNTSLGGWATVNGTDYAKVDAGVITAFTAADYTNEDNAANWLDDQVISDAGGDADTPFFGTVDGTKHLGGLKYTAAAASTVNIGTGETLGIDGTIIVAASVDVNDQTITGGSITGGAGGSTLGILQNGGGLFTIGSTIVDNGGATGFTKGGEGIVRLAGTNTYTGVTTLSGGELQIASLADAGLASSIGQASADSSNLVLESGKLHYVGGTDGSTDRGFTLVNGGASAPEIVVDASRTIEFSGLVTSPDDAGLTKTGWGTLVLSNAANDYVGVTTISGSGASDSSTISVNTLADGGVASGIGAAGSDSANLVLSDGGQLQYTGGSVDIDRGFTLASGAGRIDVAQAATTLTIEGTAVGAGRLIKEGAGTLVLTGLNTYTGNTTVNEGMLLAGSAQAFGNETTSMTVNSGAMLDLGGFAIKVGALGDGTLGGGSVSLGAATLTIGGTNGTFSGVISGSGGLTHVSGTQVMSGCNNTYTGVTTLGGGTLSVDCLDDGGEASGIGASSADSANLAFTGGRLTYTGASSSIDRGFTLQSGDGYINVNDAATVLEFEGAVVGGGRLRKEGAGTLLLSGTNTNTGDTIISGGVLRAGSNDALGSRAIAFDNTAGATLDLDGFDNTIGYLSGGGPLGGNVTLGAATLTLNWASGSGSYAGAISGSGGLIKNGGITQSFTGCASDYTGSTAINGGVLAVSCLEDGGADSSIGASTADAGNLIINGGTLRYIGTGGSTNRQFTLGASGGNALDASGTGAINFTSNAPLTFSGTDTAQTLTLTGTSIDDNTLAAEITNNGTGATSLTKTGTGTWILTNPDSSYTGRTVISGGVLGVDKLADGGIASSLGASSADAANLVIGNDSTLRYTGTGDTTNRLFTLSAGTTFIESAGTGAIVFTDTGPVTLAGVNQNRTIALGGTNADDNTLAGSIGDAGTGTTILAKNDGGTWVLTGNNTYTGYTVINDGTLKIGGGGTTGSIVSDAINLGTLVFDRSDEYIYDGVISNVGNVEQTGSGTTILTGDSTYTGGTTISDGTLQLGNGGASGSIVGDVTDNGVLAFDRSDAYTFGGTISGSGEVSQIGAGKTILTADNSYSGGTTISDGTLQLGNGGTSGSIVGDVANDGALIFDRSDAMTFAGLISGAGTVEQAGPGTTTLTADNSYSGGTTISDGTLQLGNGGTSGGIVGDVVNNGTLAVDRSNDVTLDGVISGSGTVGQIGTGTTTLTGDNSYTGATNVDAGTLFVNGDQSAAAGQTNVASGATLGGNGIIGGDVVMTGTSTLAAGNNDVGTLTINGDLTLSSGTALNYEFGEADVAGGALNDLVNVGGNLVLDGTVNVTVPTGGDFGAGIYRMFNYGTLDDQGLTLGTMPSGSDVAVQTSIVGQVNLVNSAGLLLNFWDGDAGPKNDGAVNGGNGTWQNSTGNKNWTGSTGNINAGYDDGGFAIFAGVGGTVTVDNGLGAVSASGMQFASDGYLITGGDLELVGPQSTIRVGDGTALGAGFTATIASNLTGASQLVKTDDGTLVLSGTNSYTGGTAINGGTLSISNNANLGNAAGVVSIDNGTLQTTADLTSGRIITLDGAGTLLTDASTTLNLYGIIGGVGGLTKAGAGTLVLTSANNYAGGTTIAAGTLQLGNGGASGSILGDIVDNGLLAIDRSDTVALAGVISGTGALQQVGTGTTVLTGENSYTGGTTIAAGTLQLGDGGTSGSIVGDVVDNGTLAFNRTDDVTFDGVISGSGNVVQNGTGTTDLTGISTYTGDTTANAGELRLADGGQITSTLRIFAGNNLGESGIITVDGAGSKLNIAGSIAASSLVGDNGTGTLNITDGGVVTGGLIRLGNGTTGQGTLNVSGEGSSYTTTIPGTSGSSIWRVGGRGEGIVNVTAGGDIQNSGDVWFGAYAGGEGTATVSGTGSTWDIGGALALVNGSMSVLDGGVVHTDSADIGYTPLVSGDTNVLVSGTGSRLETTAGFRLNAASGHTGVLTVADDGAVSVGSGTLAITGGDTALNIGGAEGAAATAAGSLEATSVTMATATNRVNFNHTDTDYVFASLISGAGAVNQTGPGTTILTADNSYTGGTTITAGVLQLGNGGTSGAIVGDVANDGSLIFNRSDDVTFGGVISGAGTVEQAGAGATILTATNTYTGGTTISAGTLQIGDGGMIGSIVGDVANDGSLIFDRSDDVTFGGVISGSGMVEQAGAGTTILTGDSDYAGGTTISNGILQLGDGGTSGSITGDVTNNTAFIFNRSDLLTLDGVISGSGAINQIGTGTTVLTGDNSYVGTTTVSSGGLYINGDQSAANGPTDVLAGAMLGGIGTIGGDVTVVAGIINPGDLGSAPGTLTINGMLSLDGASTLNYNFGQADVVGGAFNDLIEVGGDLALDGTLNVQSTPGTSFDPGVYRVISYDGDLTTNSLTIGAIPSPDFYLQTSVDHQVNLVNTAGMTLRYWDGATMASKNSGTIEGGDGVWQAAAGGTGNDNWTEETGAANAPFTDAAFAVFMGTAGTVSVDNGLGDINVSGMQFATDGYHVQDGVLNLVGGSSIIRVGDGTGPGAAFTATIDSELTGTSQLVKTDLGTLILTADNTYTGGTAVNGGTLLVNGDQSAASGLTSVGAATLGGTGIVGGDVDVVGGTIAPGSNGVGTLTVKGGMTLDAGSTLAMEFGEADAVGGTLNDLIEVGGDLTLDGTINVTEPAGGSFDVGIYRVFNYGGNLTDNGLDIGTMPAGSAAIVQTSIDHQVNLINTGGLFLNFWDGDAGPKFDGAVNGGDGVWQSGSGNNNWTDSAGALNAPYQNGGFAVFAGAPGTVTIDNGLGQVTASGMQFASGGYTITGGGLELVGAQATIRVGDGTGAGSAFTATLASEISGASELTKTDLGTLVLTGTNTYTGGTAINGGTLQVAADTALGDAAGGLSFDAGALHTTADMTSDRSIAFAGDGTLLTDAATTFTLNGLLSGSGALTKDGAGTLLITADNSGYLGSSQVNDGTLAVDGILGGDVDVAIGGRLEGNGQVGGVTNAGVVGPGSSIGTLTVAGDYAGNGGLLEIETTLGDDSSPTDLLAVNGDTSGATTVNVINRGGLGAQTVEGIKIIDVAGASNGAFTLDGDYLFDGEEAVVAGAYGYRLYKNGVADPADGDWYLRSALLDPADPGPLYQPGVPIYESYAGSLQQFNNLGTLQQRVGNRVWSPQSAGTQQVEGNKKTDASGIWARIEAAHADLGPDGSTSRANYDANTWKLHAGIDGLLLENDAGRLVGGVTAQYGTVSSSIWSPYGAGVIDTTGYGVGATLTWYGENGFYMDGQAQVTWYDSDLLSATAGRSLVKGNGGMGYGLSIEAGQRLTLSENWSLTPQAQLAYSSVDFDDFTDAFGARVSLGSSESLIGRLGLAVNHDTEWQEQDGSTSRAHVYGIANLYYDFGDGSVVDVAGTGFSSGDSQLHGGLGIGGSINWADDKYSVFGEANVSTNLENIGNNNAIGGTVGFRVHW